MKRTRYIICDYNIDEEIEQNLIKFGVTPIKLHGVDRFGEDNLLNCHPDMFCFKLEENRWLFYDEVYKINKNILDKLSLEIIPIENPISCGYPFDVGLNAAKFGDYLICNVRYTNEKVIRYFYENNKNIKIINVKQGYAKCSVCIVDENSIITSDVSIYKQAKQNNINVLLIEPGHIDLNGYDYGFIGGCSGLIYLNKLAFTGNIDMHPNCGDIKKFCGGRGVEIVSLSENKLYDYGSLFVV